MKHLRSYSVFEASASAPAPLTQEQIEWLNQCTKGTWKLNPQTGEVDVDGDFYCSERGLADFKGVRFGEVRGDFHCQQNQLTSLVGAPQKVGGSFYCQENQLTSLVGAPQKVGGFFYCGNNQLTSLVGAPREVGRRFYCGHNQLTSLVGAPQKVQDFDCWNNPIPEKTLNMIFDLMQKGYDYAVALGMLKSQISKRTWNKLQKPEGYDYDVLGRASDFGII